MSKARRSSFDKGTALKNLCAGRAGALAVCMSYRINGEEYRAACGVVETIDMLVECLTGDPGHLHAEPHRTRTGSNDKRDQE